VQESVECPNNVRSSGYSTAFCTATACNFCRPCTPLAPTCVSSLHGNIRKKCQVWCQCLQDLATLETQEASVAAAEDAVMQQGDAITETAQRQRQASEAAVRQLQAELQHSIDLERVNSAELLASKDRAVAAASVARQESEGARYALRAWREAESISEQAQVGCLAHLSPSIVCHEVTFLLHRSLANYCTALVTSQTNPTRDTQQRLHVLETYCSLANFCTALVTNPMRDTQQRLRVLKASCSLASYCTGTATTWRCICQKHSNHVQFVWLHGLGVMC
jgi:hypothetical protein